MMQAPSSFTDYVVRLRTAIDAELDRVLPRPPACPALVAEAMRYSIQVGGKRLRPVLTLAVAEAVAEAAHPGDAIARVEAHRLAMPAACAVELLHTYSLVHDDLPAMDNDSLRRGKPTLHVIYGDGLAILAGDGLLAEAFALLATEPSGESVAPPPGAPTLAVRRLQVVREIGFAVGAAGMVGGQAIDLECAGLVTRPDGGRLTLDADGLRDMHARKTGALLTASAVCGAMMAGAAPSQVEAIRRYASELGIVFQIVDDILDVQGTTASLGKTAGKDEAAGKPTYPALFGLASSQQLARDGTARAIDALVAERLDTPHLRDLAQWVLTRQA